MKAAQLAPDAMLLPTDFDAYRKYSRLFKAAVRDDRAADPGQRHRRDLHRPHRRRSGGADRPSASRRPRCVDARREVAQSIKDAVRAATGLSCSIGVAPNKLLAKIASELDKPDGLTIVRDADVARADLAAAGAQDQRHRSEVRREARGARHPHDRRSRARPIPHGWSSTSARTTAHGCTTPRTAATSGPSSPHSEPKSISRETTFERDLSATRDRAQLSRDLHRPVRRRRATT